MADNQLPIEMELAPQAGLNGNVPNGLNVHEQPAPPTPQPTFCIRHENQFKLLFISLLIVSLFIGGWLGSRNASRCHQPSRFTCALATTVALDGSGNYTSIRRALEMAPRSSHLEYCIYIKLGVYKEEIIINKTQTNMVLIDEGSGKTTVSGSNLSSKPTREVFAEGFIAKDIAFESLLGAKRNATAAYIVGNKCAFHHCGFQGNESTLMVDEQRQFFRDCKIFGSTSVIYGGATTVFQNCTTVVGQPSGEKDNIISIQGRNSTFTAGFIFQACRILSGDNGDLTMGHTFIASPLGAGNLLSGGSYETLHGRTC